MDTLDTLAANGAANAWAVKRRLALVSALNEAAGARARRNLLAIATELEEVVAVPDAERLDAAVRRARAMVAMEEVLVDGPPDGASAAGLETFVTRQQFASPVASQVMTSLAEVALASPTARALCAIVAELVAMVEADAPADGRVRLFLASEVDGGVMTLAFAAHGVEESPVPGASAARSLRLAEHLALLSGGDLVRGFRDGMMLVGVTVAVTSEG